MIESFRLVSEQAPWFFWIFVFLIGACVGSFLNVCIHRIPRGQSIVYPPSQCPKTGERIAWYDNIPLISWFILGGKSRHNRVPISIRYPVVELLTAVCFLASWLVWKDESLVLALVGMFFVSILIAATFIDLEHMIIPDRFSIGGAMAGMVISVAFPALHGITEGGIAAHFQSGLQAMLGLMVGTAIIYWIGTVAELLLRKPAMGEGDWKFLGMIGVFCGWKGAVFALFGGAFIGVMILIPFMLKSRFSASGETGEGRGEEGLGFGMEVPFGPMLALGGLLYFLFLRGPVDLYFDSLRPLFEVVPEYSHQFGNR